MMTNPAAAMRMLITYAICIPLAIFIGYLLTNPLDYGTLGFIAFVTAALLSPIFIKWHYPIMVFGLSFPAYFFFLKGNPPCWQVVVMISLGIAIVERTLSSKNHFLKAPAMTWALMFTAAMAVITMQLTGGFGLHALGGNTGGGQKYISLFLGIAIFFALASRGIPPEQRKLYIGLFFLSGAFGFISDMFPFLPAPFNYINLIFPPSSNVLSDEGSFGSGFIMRFGALAVAAVTVIWFLLARYSLRGVLSAAHPFRALLFCGLFVLSLLGGYRSIMINTFLILGILFVMEGLYRTRWLPVILIFILGVGCLVVPFAKNLPYTFQRALSVLPFVEVDSGAQASAEGSSEWRLRIWQAVWPKVPDYLLLGKGYALTALDYESMGRDNPFAASAQVDASMESLAISNDFHSGPLSTIICFGVWGGISILAIILAAVYITYRNYKYGDPELRIVNTLLLAGILHHTIFFLFIYGAFDSDVGYFAKFAGFSVALNWGVRGPKARVPFVQRIKPLSQPLAA